MSEEEPKTIAGIDPATRRCVSIGFDCMRVWADMKDDGLIVVPVEPETARRIYMQNVPDIYAIARGVVP